MKQVDFGGLSKRQFLDWSEASTKNPGCVLDRAFFLSSWSIWFAKIRQLHSSVGGVWNARMHAFVLI